MINPFWWGLVPARIFVEGIMSEQKPGNKLITIGKMIAICVICLGVIYGIVSLVMYLSA
jgi:hypothetical protein